MISKATLAKLRQKVASSVQQPVNLTAINDRMKAKADVAEGSGPNVTNLANLTNPPVRKAKEASVAPADLSGKDVKKKSRLERLAERRGEPELTKTASHAKKAILLGSLRSFTNVPVGHRVKLAAAMCKIYDKPNTKNVSANVRVKRPSEKQANPLAALSRGLAGLRRQAGQLRSVVGDLRGVGREGAGPELAAGFGRMSNGNVAASRLRDAFRRLESNVANRRPVPPPLPPTASGQLPYGQ